MRGQAFTVFKMMIAAAFAMALLVVIYQATSNIGCPSPAVNEIEVLVLDASKIPGDCVIRKNMCFDKGVFLTSSFYEDSLNMNHVEFEYDTNLGLCSSTNKCDKFKDKTVLPVSVKCNNPDDCTIYLAKDFCS